MFKSLKEKLSAFKRKLDEKFKREEVVKAVETPVKAEVKEVKSETVKTVEDVKKVETPKEEKPKKVGLKDKIVALVKDREVVIDEKSVEEILEDLEIILLESDVALEVVGDFKTVEGEVDR